MSDDKDMPHCIIRKDYRRAEGFATDFFPAYPEEGETLDAAALRMNMDPRRGLLTEYVVCSGTHQDIIAKHK